MLAFVLAMAITRGVLFGYALMIDQVTLGISSALVFIAGAVYDICTGLWFLPLIMALSLITPKAIANNSLFKFSIIFIAIFYLISSSIGEVLFWDEFGTRFNFIAVDYLIYMDEVVKNIYESYPIIKLLILSALCAATISFKLCKTITITSSRLKELMFSLLFSAISCFYISSSTIELPDRYENELAHNGIYNLFSAFKNNSLDYPSFYKTIDNNKAFQVVQHSLGMPESGDLSIKRFVNNGKAKKGYNVILITVESLSAEYMARFGNKDNLTPFLDSLSKESLFFSNFYATGTRTVRGLEAITLSIPPTPGNSIVRMPGNENLFSLGTVLNQHNYSTKFLYGGFGYFDNMNHFFSHNHFQTLDRSSLNNEEITFSNAWGVADEDIYRRAIKEADQDFAKQKNFFYFIMTTSNHRPFTYPNDKAKTPTGGRNGAVQYTDFAIKQIIEAAKDKPWFDNTIFVITADHCAGSSGKNDLPPKRYHIPLLIYAPKLLQASEIKNMSSQIDLAPTVLAMLGLSYESKFYGTDILHHPANRALISTYQKLGHYTPGTLIVLGPKQEATQYDITEGQQTPTHADDHKMIEAISPYQSAYYLFHKGKMKE